VTFRTSLHGKCLLNGQHTPGSQAERECPLRNATQRSEQARKASQTRWEAHRAPAEHRVVLATGSDAAGSA
jgi:hypothetical protein